MEQSDRENQGREAIKKNLFMEEKNNHFKHFESNWNNIKIIRFIDDLDLDVSFVKRRHNCDQLCNIETGDMGGILFFRKMRKN